LIYNIVDQIFICKIRFEIQKQKEENVYK